MPKGYHQPPLQAQRKQRAIDMIVAGKSYRAIAEELGTTRATLWHWRTHNKAFREQLAIAQREATVEARETISLWSSRAVETIVALMEDVTVKPDVRLRAAAEILDRAGVVHVEERGTDDANVLTAGAESEMVRIIAGDKRLLERVMSAARMLPAPVEDSDEDDLEDEP
jgi:transposase